MGLAYVAPFLLHLQSDVARSARQQRALKERAEAGQALQAAHRWCVSGTPLASPDDILAVLRFLRHQPFSDDAWARVVLLPALTGKYLGESIKGKAAPQMHSLTSATAVRALVERHGSGLALLRALLAPILWRNTVARVRELGLLSIPPVHVRRGCAYKGH